MELRPQEPSFDAAALRGLSCEPGMALALAANFGNVECWRQAFVSSARSRHAGRRRRDTEGIAMIVSIQRVSRLKFRALI